MVDVSLAFGGKSKHTSARLRISKDFDNLVGPPGAIAKEVDLDKEVYGFGLVMCQVQDFFVEAGH